MEFVEEQGLAIVANGSFNPAIFHPAWLAKEGIITADEDAAAEIEIVHSEIARFNFSGVSIDVQSERFVIKMDVEPFVRAADLFYLIFGEKLPHAPVRSVGINFIAHASLGSFDQRQRFGRRLAPIEAWGPFGERMERKERSKTGGFSTLVMRASYEEFGESGAVNVTIQPSTRVANDAGVFISVNNHFSEDVGTENGMATVIVDRFDEAVQNSREIISHLISEGRRV